MEAVVVIILAVLGGAGLKVHEHFLDAELAAISNKPDIHKLYRLELEIYGYSDYDCRCHDCGPYGTLDPVI